ncbi:MAG TPA: sugar ABC transporter permease [Anaerolineae bacterium]|nr:sugar ABC transporter permease [Anaerolineae bacterium]
MKRNLLGYLLLAPAMVAILAVVIYPLLYSVYVSLTDLTIGMPMISFVGLSNYLDSLKDPIFKSSLLTTIEFTFIAVTTEFLLGFGVALLLYREFRGRDVIRTITLLPMMITPVVVGIIWLLLYQPDFSLINYLLSLIGIEGPLWLQSRPWALISIIVADIWHWSPFFVLLLSSGLLSLPQDPLEAARVDGASNVQVFWHIMLPLLRPLIMVALLLRIIEAFKVFDKVYVMTEGGPGIFTEVLSFRIWKEAFMFRHFGYSASMSYYMIIILSILAMVLFRLLRREEM